MTPLEKKQINDRRKKADLHDPVKLPVKPQFKEAVKAFFFVSIAVFVLVMLFYLVVFGLPSEDTFNEILRASIFIGLGIASVFLF